MLYLEEVSKIIHADAVNNRGCGARIAICDTGFTPHRDIKNVVDGINFTFQNGGDIRKFRDGHSHGTHTAGIISYLAPECEMYICKVLDDRMIGLSLSLQMAIDYCIEKKIRIINMSLSMITDLHTMRGYVKRAFENNILIIAAAGNGGCSSSFSDYAAYPGRYSSVVCVGACNLYGRPAPFSSRGRSIDLMAPGDFIVSCDNNGGYTKKSGTSQAAPIVTAMASRILAREPQLNAAGLCRRLLECTRDMGFKRCEQGRGLIDMSKYNEK